VTDEELMELYLARSEEALSLLQEVLDSFQ